jgi:hypothetical protein
MKRLAIVGLLIPLATVWIQADHDALKGSPKQGVTKPGSGQSGQQKAEAKDNGSTSPKPPTAVVQPTSPIDDAAKEEARENLQIQRELAVFTGLLVFFGFLQVGTMYWQARLLRRTLNELHTQANWMETQAGHMKDQTKILGESVAVAQTSAEAANAQIQIMKERERARLAITPTKVTELLYGWVGYNNILFEVENHGPTSAFNVRGQGYAYSLVIGGELPKIEAEPFPISDVIKANSVPLTSEAGFWLDDGFLGELNPRDAKIRVELSGAILYDDILGNPHATVFQYFMDIWNLELVKDEGRATIKTSTPWKKTLDGNYAT